MRFRRPLPTLARQQSRPLRLLLGLAAIGAGLHLTTRPLTSLNALVLYVGISCVVVGIGEWGREGSRRTDLAIGTSWTLLGAAMLVFRDAAIEALPLVVALVLLASGVVRLAGVRTGTLDARLAAGLLGAGELVLGVVVLAWADPTLIIVAAIFGIRAVLVGAPLVWSALTPTERAPSETQPGRIRRWAHVAVAVVALVASLDTLGLSNALRDAAPEADSFYAVSDDVPGQPGELIRVESFDREVPSGARGWRILYTTTDEHGESTVASGLVLVPERPAAAGGRPVVAWAHGTTGYAPQCAPSVLPEPFTAGAFPAVLDQVVERGWAVVAPDYVGLGVDQPHPYLVGKVSGRAVLDAVRAARDLEASELSDRTVVWGHSQGGGAALWTQQVQPTYAPDVPLQGTVAMAPAADLPALAKRLPGITGGTVFAAFLLEGFTQTYDDLDLRKLLRPGSATLINRIASRCLAEPGVLVSVLTALALGDQDVFRGDPTKGPLGKRLQENIPMVPGPGPLLIAQGESDALIGGDSQAAYARRLQEAGADVTYRGYPGLDHMPLVQEGSPLLPLLLRWTEARFSG